VIPILGSGDGSKRFVAETATILESTAPLQVYLETESAPDVVALLTHLIDILREKLRPRFVLAIHGFIVSYCIQKIREGGGEVALRNPRQLPHALLRV
jgi:hypothetical protein